MKTRTKVILAACVILAIPVAYIGSGSSGTPADTSTPPPYPRAATQSPKSLEEFTAAVETLRTSDSKSVDAFTFALEWMSVFREHPDEVLGLLDKIENRQTRQIFSRSFFERLIEVDPVFAASIVMTSRNPYADDNTKAYLIAALAKERPSMLNEVVGKLGEEGRPTLVSGLSQYYMKNPGGSGAVPDYFPLIDSDAGKAGLMDGLEMGMGPKSESDLRSWLGTAEKLDLDGGRELILRGFGERQVTLAAKAIAEDQTLGPQDKDNLILGIAEQNPASACDLAHASGSDPEVRKTAMAHWLETDSFKAAEWVEALQSGDERSAYISQVVAWLKSKGNVSEAEQWKTKVDR